MEGTLQTQRYDQKTTLACDVHAEDLSVNEPASPKNSLSERSFCDSAQWLSSFSYCRLVGYFFHPLSTQLAELKPMGETSFKFYRAKTLVTDSNLQCFQGNGHLFPSRGFSGSSFSSRSFGDALLGKFKIVPHCFDSFPLNFFEVRFKGGGVGERMSTTSRMCSSEGFTW